MKNGSNTHYHYLVPEWMKQRTSAWWVETFRRIPRTKRSGFSPVRFKSDLIPFSVTRIKEGYSAADDADKLIIAYAELLQRFGTSGAEWVQLDEPALVLDMEKEDKVLFVRLYKALLPQKGFAQILLQTYFGDIRDVYKISVPGFRWCRFSILWKERDIELVPFTPFPKATKYLAGIGTENRVGSNYAQTLELIRDCRVR
jgi:5-methyltetrahydropteroyltriglutamate--homocysteine methyltransferase